MSLIQKLQKIASHTLPSTETKYITTEIVKKTPPHTIVHTTEPTPKKKVKPNKSEKKNEKKPEKKTEKKSEKKTEKSPEQCLNSFIPELLPNLFLPVISPIPEEPAFRPEEVMETPVQDEREHSTFRTPQPVYQPEAAHVSRLVKEAVKESNEIWMEVLRRNSADMGALATSITTTGNEFREAVTELRQIGTLFTKSTELQTSTLKCLQDITSVITTNTNEAKQSRKAQEHMVTAVNTLTNQVADDARKGRRASEKLLEVQQQLLTTLTQHNKSFASLERHTDVIYKKLDTDRY